MSAPDDLSLDLDAHSLGLWKTSQVAKLLGMSRKQVWRLWATGKLPGYKLDRDLRFALVDVRAFLADGYSGNAKAATVILPPPPPSRSSKSSSPYRRI